MVVSIVAVSISQSGAAQEACWAQLKLTVPRDRRFTGWTEAGGQEASALHS